MKHLLLALALVAAPAAAHTVGVHTFTWHDRPTYPVDPAHDADGRAARPYRSNTFGLYARHDSGIAAGAYRNSFYGTSGYIGYAPTWGTKTADVGLIVGRITGYRSTDWLAAATVRLHVVRLVYVPRYTRLGAHSIHGALELTL